MKYKYNYVNRYESTDIGNTGALHFGSFIHEIFEKGYTSTSLNQLLEIANGLKDKYDFPDKYNKDIEKCLKNFLRFNAQLPKETLIEHHFVEEVIEGIKHEGYIDRIVKSPSGTVLVIDYKTSRREKSKFELFNDNQGNLCIKPPPSANSWSIPIKYKSSFRKSKKWKLNEIKTQK